ncbi:MAG: aminotransferase class I/II-fold pyridoxal phosphate-dependent enzyme [Acidobacteriota bacterium]
MTTNYKRLDTKLIHAGEPSPRICGAVSLPIFQSAMYEYAGETSYHDLKYIRLNNTPNHQVLHQKLAALENGESAVVTGSGMAAIATSLLSVLRAGDHLLAQDCLYGGTHDLITQDFPSLGLSCDFIDGNDPDSWKAKLRPNSRAIYVEVMTNPLLQVADLPAVVQFARDHNLVALIDSTFASPVNFRPLDWGFDLSLHSGTKYLNGHSDIVSGAIIGSAARIKAITHRLNHLGGTLDPHAAFLLHRGLKTLALRVRHQNQSALRLAQFLEKHPNVARVNYPGLASHPSHSMAGRLFDGFGGVLSFEPASGMQAADRFLTAVKLPVIAPSLGSVETLATRPSLTSHAGLTAQQRREIGISDQLIRISVGIEAIEELVEDFDEALKGTSV